MRPTTSGIATASSSPAIASFLSTTIPSEPRAYGKVSLSLRKYRSFLARHRVPRTTSCACTRSQSKALSSLAPRPPTLPIHTSHFQASPSVPCEPFPLPLSRAVTGDGPLSLSPPLPPPHTRAPDRAFPSGMTLAPHPPPSSLSSVFPLEHTKEPVLVAPLLCLGLLSSPEPSRILSTSSPKDPQVLPAIVPSLPPSVPPSVPPPLPAPLPPSLPLSSPVPPRKCGSPSGPTSPPALPHALPPALP